MVTTIEEVLNINARDAIFRGSSKKEQNNNDKTRKNPNRHFVFRRIDYYYR